MRTGGLDANVYSEWLDLEMRERDERSRLGCEKGRWLAEVYVGVIGHGLEFFQPFVWAG